MKKRGKQILFLTIVFSLFLIPLIFAITPTECASGSICKRINHGGGGETNLYVGSICYNLVNNHISNDYFIPLNSVTEFNAFVSYATANPSSGIQITNCLLDGGWSQNYYGTCSATCDGGHREVRKYCDNPVPTAGGTNCVVDSDYLSYKSCDHIGCGFLWLGCCSYTNHYASWLTGTNSQGIFYEYIPQSADSYDGLNHCNTESCSSGNNGEESETTTTTGTGTGVDVVSGAAPDIPNSPTPDPYTHDPEADPTETVDDNLMGAGPEPVQPYDDSLPLAD